MLLEAYLPYGFLQSKDLAERTQSDKVLKGKAFTIVSDPKYDGYQQYVFGLPGTLFCLYPYSN